MGWHDFMHHLYDQFNALGVGWKQDRPGWMSDKPPAETAGSSEVDKRALRRTEESNNLDASQMMQRLITSHKDVFKTDRRASQGGASRARAATVGRSGKSPDRCSAPPGLKRPTIAPNPGGPPALGAFRPKGESVRRALTLQKATC